MTPRMSVLDPAGRQASEIAWVWDVFYGVSIVVWVLVVAFAIVAMIVSRKNQRTLPDDPMAAQPVRERYMLRAILAAGAATVITLVALLVASIASGRALSALEHDTDMVHVRITGRQWWWQIDYEATDPTQLASTANELHVPVGVTVELQLTSGDVIHSFWVPSLHGKKDLIPGRMNRTWIRVDEPGVFRGQCAEFCGLEHANMVITVIAEPREQFEAWLAHQREPAPPPADPAAQRGLAVFVGGPCAMCHTVAGTQAGARLGPDLTHLASRGTLGAGTLANTREHLSRWIDNPQAVKPGVRMPGLRLSPEDKAALLAFLEGLK
jgi:cytochrome c oxidase subunit II